MSVLARALPAFEGFKKYQDDGRKQHRSRLRKPTRPPSSISKWSCTSLTAAEEVWIVYPKTRRVGAHFPEGHSETLANELRSTLFPGWSAALSAIFGT